MAKQNVIRTIGAILFILGIIILIYMFCTYMNEYKLFINKYNQGNSNIEQAIKNAPRISKLLLSFGLIPTLIGFPCLFIKVK